MNPPPVSALADHVDELTEALPSLRGACVRLNRWGAELATRLNNGQRLLIAGNGGSAAGAQHLSAELVGRFDRDRVALSAIALHTDTSSLTAIGNDYGYDQVFARQIHAHARPEDVLLLLSTSGRSTNLLAAATAASELGIQRWALTGPAPNPLALAVDDAVCLAGNTATVQELQLVAVHLICLALESALEATPGSTSGSTLPSEYQGPRPRAAS
ncbi:MAG: SIS domain-containing protein [Pseudonocardia sp.]|nr:SIS domain-containing protein [Pseudonocardia sp.]